MSKENIIDFNVKILTDDETLAGYSHAHDCDGPSPGPIRKTYRSEKELSDQHRSLCDCGSDIPAPSPKLHNLFQFFHNAPTLFSHYEKRLKQIDLLLGEKNDIANQALLEEKASIFRYIGNNEKALNVYNTILTVSPNNVSILLNRASLLYELGDASSALRDIAAVLKIEPQNNMAEEIRKVIEEDHGNSGPRQ